MNQIKLTSKSLKIIVEDIANKINFNHMSNITLINSSDLFITFSMYRKEKLLISLNPQQPFLSLINIPNPCGTKIGNFSDILRKEVKDGFLTSIETLNDDRVVIISYNHTNELFEKEERKIIIELIPHRPNFIIIDSENTILFASHYLDFSNERPVLKGIKYQPLVNNNAINDSIFDIDEYKKEAEEYYVQALRKRIDEQSKPILQHIKSRTKTLKNKIKVLQEEMDKANDDLEYQKIGNEILTLSYEPELLSDYIKENQIDYDSSKTPSYNSTKYFNKYKKAKRTLEMDKIELEKTEDEVAYLQDCLSEAKYMNEEDILELGNLLFPNKFKIPSKRKIESKPGEVIINNQKIYYGKNAKQNDALTFKKANKDDLFLHIKDNHGSHVIIASSNPDNEVILTACEIALLLSNKNDGEILYTKVKNVKKGSSLGQAILTSYKSYYIKSIRSKTKKLLKF